MAIESSSYKSIVKSMAVYGGAQAVQMLITILRSKLIAVFFGSQGMGINAIFQSTFAVINSFSSFGIFQSGVRDISQAHESGDKMKLSKTVSIFSKIVLLTGLLGLFICLIGSSFLSKIAFEGSNYTWHFVLLSIALLFSALSNGKVTFLQGTRSMNYLAKSTMIGAILSLVTSIPLFYFFGITGIVISIVSGSIVIYLTQFYFSKKIKLVPCESLTISETIKEGKPMLKLGSVLMLSTVMITVFTYITNIFIGRYGKIEDVGLFQGVSSITMQSIAIVVAVLASDFFPRLSAVHHDKSKVQNIVNNQAELISLIIAPIIVVLIIFAPLIIRVLLSNDFMVIVPMLRWMALSLLVRGVWLTLSYIILAKGDRKVYFIYDAFIGNGLLFLFNIIAYSIWGLQGLGISYLVGSVAVSGILYFIVKIKYGFSFNGEFFKIFIILTILVVSSFLAIQFLNVWIQYFFCGLVLITVFIYSFKILNNRIGIIQILESKLKAKTID